MIRCPGCGEENPPKFRLCGYCGTPLIIAEALPVHEVRKTVTLIFSDLKDSTALGERLDSEALHEVKERYFTAMAAEIKRHGGKIEKYIGDAIMAVFGLPRAHEDDALRAVRAAIAMRSVLSGLNEQLSSRFGVVLANRTGVNTGEVVAIDDPGADQKLATGDAVNVTARLEQAAPANEIYIGEVTYRLVRDAVEVEPVEPLTLKGKSQPVAAYRLISAHGHDGNVRRQDTPAVGRDEELAVLNTAWDTVRSERRAHLVTVIGDAGIGKSRLVRELMVRAGSDARIVCGRCLAYGEGITFWPLREMVVSAAGILGSDTPDIAREKLLACTGDADVADRMASATGLSATPFPLHEIYWGARRFIQTLAAQGPVLALFDDIHWAEPALLDLLDNLLETMLAMPVLLLATARHELLEDRPQCGERERSSRLVLRPLGRAAAAQVVTNLLGAAGAAAGPDRTDCRHGRGQSVLRRTDAVDADRNRRGAARGRQMGQRPCARRHRHSTDDSRAPRSAAGQAATRRTFCGGASFGNWNGISAARCGVTDAAHAARRHSNATDGVVTQAIYSAHNIRGLADAISLRSSPGARHGLQRPAQACTRDDAYRIRQMGRPGQC